MAHSYTSFVLPSRSYPYRDSTGSFLIPEGVVEVRDLNGDDQAIINNPARPMLEKVDRIITSCVRFPKSFTDGGGTSKKLIMGDRMCLCATIRDLSCGSEYTVSDRCTSCHAPISRKIDLRKDLQIVEMPRTFTEGDNTDVLEYDPLKGISVTLSTGMTLSLRLLDGTHQEWMAGHIRAQNSPIMKGRVLENPFFYLSIIASIAEVRREVKDEQVVTKINLSHPGQVAELAALVGKMNSRDLALLDDTYKDYDVKIDNVYPVVCGTCAVQNDLVLEMNAEFFRATSSRRIRG